MTEHAQEQTSDLKKQGDTLGGAEASVGGASSKEQQQDNKEAGSTPQQESEK